MNIDYGFADAFEPKTIEKLYTTFCFLHFGHSLADTT